MLKNVIKKVCSVMLAGVMLCGFFQLIGCYQTQSGKKSDIAGTYKLEKKTEGRDSSGEAIDLIKRDGIVEYLVITEDGKGFRIYGDNETETDCSEIRVRFIEDEDNLGYYKFIEYKEKAIDQWRKLGFYATDKVLNYGTPSISSGCVQIKESAIAYKMVSNDQTLATVESETGKTFKYTPFELVGKEDMVGAGANAYYIQIDPENGDYIVVYSDYIYFILDIHTDTLTADVYYSLKADEIQQKQLGLAMTFTMSEPDKYNVSYVMLNVGEYRFRYALNDGNIGRTELIVKKGEITYGVAFDTYIVDMDEFIGKAVEDYNASKPTPPEGGEPVEGGEQGGETGGETNE